MEDKYTARKEIQTAYYDAVYESAMRYNDDNENTVDESQNTDQDTSEQYATENIDDTEADELDELILNSDILNLEEYYDLSWYTADELRKIRNGIYARHGYIFEDQSLAEYFSHKSYYYPSVTRSEWDESV